LARLIGRLRAALVGGLLPRLPVTLAMPLPYLRRTAAATCEYVPKVPDWFALASALRARFLVSMGYFRCLG
jgi:hypothetical protein